MLPGLSQDFPLTLPYILRRAETFFKDREIVTRRPDKQFHRYTYGEMAIRARKLAVALQALGVESGDRVATLAWNSYQHLEAYFGIPLIGAVLHTVNPRLHESDLRFITRHAEDKVLIIDETLLPVLEKFRADAPFKHIVVVSYSGQVPGGMLDYEQLLASADERELKAPTLDENQAAAMCYTSGTTGQPKGVLYSHRALVLHSLVSAMTDGLSLSERDCVLPVVPMFHVNAWGLPYTTAMVGAKQVLPGPHLDPTSLLEALVQERVTVTAGVPTVYLAMLQALDAAPGAYDLSRLRTIVIGGSAAPPALITGYKERHGLSVLHAWGMTETAPLGTIAHLTSQVAEASEEVQMRYKTSQGYPVPLVEIRARGENGLVPWDGTTMGELEVRGPWIAKAYYHAPEGADRFTEDGWFKTGDIVTIAPNGYITIQDRAKDLIKSGGEWISSVALENALMAHPAVHHAAVIGLPHQRWGERPLAVVVLKPEQSADEQALRAHLAGSFATWWLPDAFAFVEAIPLTAAGKFQKRTLRERFQDFSFNA